MVTWIWKSLIETVEQRERVRTGLQRQRQRRRSAILAVYDHLHAGRTGVDRHPAERRRRRFRGHRAQLANGRNGCGSERGRGEEHQPRPRRRARTPARRCRARCGDRRPRCFGIEGQQEINRVSVVWRLRNGSARLNDSTKPTQPLVRFDGRSAVVHDVRPWMCQDRWRTPCHVERREKRRRM